MRRRRRGGSRGNASATATCCVTMIVRADRAMQKCTGNSYMLCDDLFFVVTMIKIKGF
jgi:hypothetical protein